MFKKCWMCKQIKETEYNVENKTNTINLKIAKNRYDNKYNIYVTYPDGIIIQEIRYCPICGKKLK